MLGCMIVVESHGPKTVRGNGSYRALEIFAGGPPAGPRHRADIVVLEITLIRVAIENQKYGRQQQEQDQSGSLRHVIHLPATRLPARRSSKCSFDYCCRYPYGHKPAQAE